MEYKIYIILEINSKMGMNDLKCSKSIINYTNNMFRT